MTIECEEHVTVDGEEKFSIDRPTTGISRTDIIIEGNGSGCGGDIIYWHHVFLVPTYYIRFSVPAGVCGTIPFTTIPYKGS